MLPNVITRLPSLENLDLRWNKIWDVPSWLAQLEQRGVRVLH